MAGELGVSAAYLSALEHGHRGRAGPGFVMQICEYFNLIWDDYEEMHRLAALSQPRVVVDTSGLSARATELANLLAANVARLDDAAVERMIEEIGRAAAGAPRPRLVRPRRRARRA